jgi:curved DNA-binding protein CbpA
VLGPEADADFEAVRKAWWAKALESHPDVNQGDADGAKACQAAQAAYEVLRAAEQRQEWRG